MIFPTRNSHKTSNRGKQTLCVRNQILFNIQMMFISMCYISEHRTWSPPTDRTNKNPTAHIWISSAELKTDNYHSLQSEILKHCWTHKYELERFHIDSTKGLTVEKGLWMKYYILILGFNTKYGWCTLLFKSLGSVRLSLFEGNYIFYSARKHSI